LFFGVAAVTGSYFLQTGQVSPAALLVGLMLGMLAAAVLVVNNYRDLDNDAKVGKNTLAVRLGRPATQAEYMLLLLLPFGLLPGLYLAGTGALGWILPLLGVSRAITLVKRFRRETPGSAFNDLLAATAQLQLGFAALLCLGLFLSGR
jgi:1,4-dihydroxy-2-naphthoate octaprenyltransferase